MTEPLSCQCGNAYLVRPEVIGSDGNPWSGNWDEVRFCPACGRTYDFIEDGDQVKLRLVIGHSSIVAWRTITERFLKAWRAITGQVAK